MKKPTNWRDLALDVGRARGNDPRFVPDSTAVLQLQTAVERLKHARMRYRLARRDAHQDNVEAGAKLQLQRAYDLVKALVAAHGDLPSDPDEIDAMLKQATKSYGSSGGYGAPSTYGTSGTFAEPAPSVVKSDLPPLARSRREYAGLAEQSGGLRVPRQHRWPSAE